MNEDRIKDPIHRSQWMVLSYQRRLDANAELIILTLSYAKQLHFVAETLGIQDILTRYPGDSTDLNVA
ncbi:hypothetical protein D1872_282410 [compost metagenome]